MLYNLCYTAFSQIFSPLMRGDFSFIYECIKFFLDFIIPMNLGSFDLVITGVGF